MNNRTRQAVAECDHIIEVVSRLRSVLPELERRNRYGVGGDGYPSSSFGTSGQLGAVSQPTERAALGRRERDPVRQWTRDILRDLAKLDRTAGGIASLVALILGDHVCADCNRADAPRLVGGVCDACRMRRRRAVSS